MATAFAAAREFVRGAARRPNLVYILSKGKALASQGIAHTSIIAIEDGQWADVRNVAWDSTAIAVARRPVERMIAIGEDGDVLTYAGGSWTEEQIDPAPVMIRNASEIAGYVFACGMKRQVYKRIDAQSWIDVSAPFPGEADKAGFEAIAGYSEEEVYAVGWNGEIWQYDGWRWTEQHAPTNMILTSVCCAPDGFVYAGGQQGTIVRGRGGRWELVDWEDDASIDIWDIHWFDSKIIVAGISGLFTLGDGRLQPIDVGGKLTTFFNLTSSSNILWTIGQNDVGSCDGQQWQAYD